MYCKNDAIICDMCNKFCTPYDEETQFGTKDYESPEPLDPYHYCKPCSKTLYKEWLTKLKDKKNWHSGMWQKSNAERKAAKVLELVWINSNGVGMLGTTNFANPYQYITKSEYETLSKLPYWGYCKKCNAERKNGYCSNENCLESYKLKILAKYQS